MKYSFLFFLSLILSSGLFAQLSLGLKVQTGEAWQNYGDEIAIDGFDQRIEHYGVSMEAFYPISPAISLGFAPGYLRRGAACEPGFVGSNPFLVRDATIYANYLQLPLLIKANIPLANRFSLFGQAGAGLSYLVSGHRDVLFLSSLDGGRERQELDFEQENTLNRFDFGAQAGLGFAYQLGFGSLQLSADYYHGFLDMTETNTSENRSWSVGLGYSVNINKH